MPDVVRVRGATPRLESTREAVTFRNRAGLRLFGILDRPAAAAMDTVVLLLSPGAKMRVGPERLYCTMAEHLAGLGLAVLRFDFYGLGDSEGELVEERLADVYNHVEVGRFVDDTVDAMNWMSGEYGSRQFILAGLCGGAITGLLTAQRDPRVAGLLALAITPILSNQSADPSRYMTAGQLASLRQRYLGKLLKPEAWLRFLTLRTDYKVLWRALTRPLRKAAPAATVSPAAASSPPDNANPLFPPAFFAVVESKRPMLMVFGGADRLYWEFEEKFVARHRARLDSAPRLYDIHTIAQANHVLTFPEWQQEMLEVSTGWLRRRFPALFSKSS